MGRSERHDVDYFPFYVKSGRTLKLLEYHYKAKGTGFFTNVLRELAKSPDHHIDLSDDFERAMFFVDTKVTEDEGIDMIQMMVKTGKLDRFLWEEFMALMSEDFLFSVEDAYKKRNNSCPKASEIRTFYQKRQKSLNGIKEEENPNTQEEIQKTTTETEKPEEIRPAKEEVSLKVKEKKVNNIYTHYNSKIDPEQKSSVRAKSNISYYLKHFTEEELITSIDNYALLALKRPDRSHRKDPANFFQKRDPAFKDYLPGIFKPPKDNNHEQIQDGPEQDPYYCKICNKKKVYMAKLNVCADCAEKHKNEELTPIGDIIKESLNQDDELPEDYVP